VYLCGLQDASTLGGIRRVMGVARWSRGTGEIAADGCQVRA